MSTRRKCYNVGFSMGIQPEDARKIEVKEPAIYIEVKRLRLDANNEASWLESPELVAWVKANKNSKYIPERVLRKMKLSTDFDVEPSTWSLVNGTVIAEQIATPDNSVPV